MLIIILFKGRTAFALQTSETSSAWVGQELVFALETR